MLYRLHLPREHGPRPVIAQEDVSTDPAALEWARMWLSDNGTNDRYALARGDGGFCAEFVRTAGGQWYAIAQSRT